MTDSTERFPVSNTAKPIGMVGAGRLSSMIWKGGDDDRGWHYRFNVFRTGNRGSRVSQLFSPADVVHFVKLAQVLAAVIADDGCLDPTERSVLKRLASELDGLWQRASFPVDTEDCSCIRTPTLAKGDRHGETAGS